MPKRVPTPPPGDDEPRYLTVVHPYAISGTCNMELPKDRQDFACWVASCIDKDAFFAIFHKPSSRGMVIIEIKRDYPHFDHILGEHRWSEFLQKPTKEEKIRVTQVFHCTHNSGRNVQKNGWKRIDVDEAWFKAWSPQNRNIKSPYPKTYFCDVPVEDHTTHPLCRPLPGAVKTPPVEVIATPQPVVGSAAWIRSKDGRPSPAPVATQSKKPNALGAWGQGAAKIHASAKPSPTANRSANKIVGIQQGPHTAARIPAVGGGPIAVKASNVWHNTGKKAQVATSWDESPPVSRESTPATRAISPAAHQAPAASSGLSARKNAWESGTASYPTQPPGLALPGKSASVVQRSPDRVGNFSAASWDSAGASTSSPDSDSGPDLTTATESDNPYNVHIHFSGSMEEEFHGMGITAADDDYDDELGELDAIAPGAWDAPMADATWETNDTAGWDDNALDAEDHWRQNQEPTTKPILCNAHGIICKKGICAEYARQLRLTKRAKEEEERKAAGANKGKKGGRGGRGRGAGKNDENESEDRPFGKNVAPNPFRGPGAPVKTNWRGAPRNIVSADVIERREATKAAFDDGWGNSDSEVNPNAAAVTSAGPADSASDASWDIPKDAFNPWAITPVQPAAKANRSGGKPQDKKKPLTGRTSSNWADQVDAEIAASGDADTCSTVSYKRGSKHGTSTTSRGTSAAKSSTSGWGSVPDMPW
ncbi:hypothetical protein L210DRAFT_3506421 [Boletus edulis BED1]|uniref:Uncharacterized protein n=1 Tax=Boletus edulis BED1 TaxID=1328754 RepID=A0AAD4BMW2_BOLED|nr:hypothetical protein L210DRAFT_3506421 [Boletus edulis BED1]